LREMARFLRERGAPKMKSGLSILHEQAKKAVPFAKKGAEKGFALAKNRIAPKAKEHAYIAAEFARQTLAPKAQRSLAVAFAAFVRANRRAAQITKERGIPAAKKAGRFMKETGLPFAARTGKEAIRVIREKLVPGSAAATQTMLEKARAGAATAGRKGWERDVAEIAIKTGIDKRTLTRTLYWMVKGGMKVSNARMALQRIHEVAGSRELARAAFEKMHEDIVKNRVSPTVVHKAMLDAIKKIKENPELAKKFHDVYMRARAEHFLRMAEPPTPEEIERMSLKELKSFIARQHPGWS